MKKVKLLLVVVSFLAAFSCLGQREFDGDSDWTFRDRSYFGIGLSGLNFGTNASYGKFFSIGVSGQLGYMLINNLSVGIGLEYQYDSYGDVNVKNHTYGGYPFIRYNFKSFFVQTDYDLVTMKVNFAGGEAKQSFERFFVGLGYSSEAGSNAYLNILASYDLLYTNTSPFSSPLSIRIYFTGWLN